VIELVKHPLFDCDLEEAALWYSRDDSGVSYDLIVATESAMRAAVRTPLQFPVRYKHYRRIRLSRFPHSVYYRFEEDTVYMLALIHGARDVEQLLKQRMRTM